MCRLTLLFFLPSTSCALPATVAPIGRTAQNLPIAVQVVGPYLGDLSTIGLARIIERDYAGYTVPESFAA